MRVGEKVRDEARRVGYVEKKLVHRLEERPEAIGDLRRAEHAARVQRGEEAGGHLALAAALVHGECDGALDDGRMMRPRAQRLYLAGRMRRGGGLAAEEFAQGEVDLRFELVESQLDSAAAARRQLEVVGDPHLFVRGVGLLLNGSFGKVGRRAVAG